MSTEPAELTDAIRQGIELEYHTLRAEALQRIEMRQQIFSVTLTAAGVFLAVGIGTPTIALVYPLLGLFLAYGWAHNDHHILDVASYIRTEIEEKYPQLNLHWEKTMNAKRAIGGQGNRRLSVLSHGGAILTTQVVAAFIGLAQSNWQDPLIWALAGVDLISVLMVYDILHRARR
jgi:hypothetical protein